MIEIVKKVIKEWDPIELLNYTPWDEYDKECEEIVMNIHCDFEMLGQIIYNVFSYSFEDAFQEDLISCEQIARNIKKLINDKYHI